MAKSQPKDLWYVDFRGKITGPLPTSRIVDELIGGQLKVIYRVSRDKKNWKAICNELHFDQYIQEELKKLNAEATKYDETTNANGEHTGFANLTSIRKGITEQLQHAESLQLINLNLSNLRQLLAEILAKRKMVVEIKETVVDELHPDDQNEYISQPTFWERLRKRESKAQMQVLGLVVALFLGYFFYNKYLESRERQSVEQAQQQALDALHSKTLGDYDKAIALFQGVRDTKKLDPQVLLEMADAYLQKKKTIEGVRLVNRALEGDLSGGDRARAHALLAQVAMQNNDFNKAETLYEDSIKESAVFSSMHNMAAVELKLGHPEKAEELLLKALQLPYTEKGPSLMLLYQAAVATAPGDSSNAAAKADRLSRLYNLLGNFTEDTSFHAHLAVERIMVAHKLNRLDDVEAQMQEFIESATGDFNTAVAPLDLDSAGSGAAAYSWCVELYSANRVGAMSNAFMASCTMKAKGAKIALPYAEYALKMGQGISTFRGLVGFIWTQLGDVSRAKRALLEGPRLTEPSNLWTAAAGRICQLQPNTANCNLASDPQYATSVHSRAIKAPQRSTSSVRNR